MHDVTRTHSLSANLAIAAACRVRAQSPRSTACCRAAACARRAARRLRPCRRIQPAQTTLVGDHHEQNTCTQTMRFEANSDAQCPMRGEGRLPFVGTICVAIDTGSNSYCVKGRHVNTTRTRTHTQVPIRCSTHLHHLRRRTRTTCRHTQRCCVHSGTALDQRTITVSTSMYLRIV
jgi:hypothetical protein